MALVIGNLYEKQTLCGTIKCKNASVCEKEARCEEISWLNMKSYALYVKNNSKNDFLNA